MILISNFRPLRIHLGYPRALLATVTHIPHTRLRDVELRKAEPWFDEALGIAQALGHTIGDLISSDDLTTFDADPRFYSADLMHWRNGVRLPLSTALRIARKLGLSRVDDLAVPAIAQQIWSVLEATERHPEAPGWCPWCQADIVGGDQHKEHCLPANLYGLRVQRVMLGTVQPAEAPRPRAIKRVGSAPARGLKYLREQLDLRQIDMANVIGVNVNHYARMERCDLPLTLTKADLIANVYNISQDVLYAQPPELPPVPPAPEAAPETQH